MAPMCKPLSTLLKRLLLSYLLSRHVEVVHKDDALHAQGRSKHAFPPLVQLVINDVLRLVGTRLRRKVEENRSVLVAGILVVPQTTQ